MRFQEGLSPLYWRASTSYIYIYINYTVSWGTLAELSVDNSRWTLWHTRAMRKAARKRDTAAAAPEINHFLSSPIRAKGEGRRKCKITFINQRPSICQVYLCAQREPCRRGWVRPALLCWLWKLKPTRWLVPRFYGVYVQFFRKGENVNQFKRLTKLN